MANPGTHVAPVVSTAVRSAAELRLVLVGLDDHARGRIEAASRYGAWTLLAARGAADAEHAAVAGNASVIVASGANVSADEIRRLSRRQAAVSVVVWAAGLSSEGSAQLLLAGAADVLSSRMAELEIYARISRTVQRGSQTWSPPSALGELEVDSFRGEARWHGDLLPLTNRERDVLDVLAREQGKTLRRQVIYQRVWGHAMPAGDRNVDVNVKRLREKLAASTGGEITVETVSRVGYRLLIATPSLSGRDS